MALLFFEFLFPPFLEVGASGVVPAPVPRDLGNQRSPLLLGVANCNQEIRLFLLEGRGGRPNVGREIGIRLLSLQQRHFNLLNCLPTRIIGQEALEAGAVALLVTAAAGSHGPLQFSQIHLQRRLVPLDVLIETDQQGPARVEFLLDLGLGIPPSSLDLGHFCLGRGLVVLRKNGELHSRLPIQEFRPRRIFPVLVRLDLGR